MKGLLLKDWYAAVRYCRIHLGFIVFFSVASLFIDMGVSYLFYPILFAGMIPVYILSAEEKCRWTQYVQTMPFRRRDVVREKYILTLLFVGVSLAFMLALWLGRIALVGGSVAELCRSLVLILAMGLIFPALTLPPMFRFGVEKGRIITIGLAGVMAAGILVYATVSMDGQSLSPESFGGVLALNVPVLAVIAAALFGLSWLLAEWLYAKREL